MESADKPSKETSGRGDGPLRGKRGSQDASLSEEEVEHSPRLKKAKFPWQVKNLRQSPSWREESSQEGSGLRCSEWLGDAAGSLDSGVGSGEWPSTSADSRTMMNPEMSAEIARIESILPESDPWLESRGTTSPLVAAEGTSGLHCHLEDICSDADSESIGHCSVASADGSAGEEASDESGGPSMLSRWRRTYCEQWQVKHMVNAIVENAINRTLEDVGLGPAAPSNQLLESEGVAAAIQAQGLRAPGAGIPPQDRSALNPLISRLTEVSESLFSETMEVAMSPIAPQTWHRSRHSSSTSQGHTQPSTAEMALSPFLPHPAATGAGRREPLGEPVPAFLTRPPAVIRPSTSRPSRGNLEDPVHPGLPHLAGYKPPLELTTEHSTKCLQPNQSECCPPDPASDTLPQGGTDPLAPEDSDHSVTAELCSSGEGTQHSLPSSPPEEPYNLAAPALCTVDIINQAVTAAISEKGLAFDSSTQSWPGQEAARN